MSNKPDDFGDAPLNFGPPHSATVEEKAMPHVATAWIVRIERHTVTGEMRERRSWFWWVSDVDEDLPEAVAAKRIFHGPFDTEREAQVAADAALGKWIEH